MNRKFSFFIIGGTGDLSRKKLLPALYKLYKEGHFKNLHKVYSLAREESKEWKDLVGSFNEPEKFENFLHFDVRSDSSYHELGKVLQRLRGQELIFYLALSPFLFETTVRKLGRLLRTYTNPRKIVVEKPFGFDLTSAKKLNQILYTYFVEEEIYRIDHFLGKETVQNIFSLRLSNTIFEGLWNKNFVDHVQILALEDIGIEGRGEYYDKVGAVRDMLQNHMLQMLSFLAMEPPCCMHPEYIRDEKVKLLRSVRRVSDTVKGQYEGYPSEKGVGENTRTETFVAIKLYIDNLRWQDVPFYLMTGKRLSKKLSQITVVFREIPRSFAKLLDCMPKQNKIVFQTAPKNKIAIHFELRPPAGKFISCPIETIMEYDMESYAGTKLPEAYETLILDIVEGDRSLFIRGDEVEIMWEIVEPIMDDKIEVYTYKQGSLGPEKAHRLIEKDGKTWIL
ncbi:glucose-6-phosphate dehydrogenase [Hydrogenobacter thermophilus]|uniref:glucose-6-phosphate dehydrogenase n=1 Tax=Hydrogenobacter thermophilus TaxID=940 RepID=UPI0030F54520